ncbi:unnamed protein product [Penicillium viridicatum]
MESPRALLARPLPTLTQTTSFIRIDNLTINRVTTDLQPNPSIAPLLRAYIYQRFQRLTLKGCVDNTTSARRQGVWACAMLPAVWDLSEAVGGDRSSICGRKMDSSPTRMSDDTGQSTKERNGSATDSENNSEHSPEDHNTESIPGIDDPSRDNSLASPEYIDFYSKDLVESDLEGTEDGEGDEDNGNERNAFRAQNFPRTGLLENTYPKTSLTYLNLSS